jgi:translation initiation factor 4A
MRGGDIRSLRKPKVLIISPVRELSNQTFNVLTQLGKFCDNLKVTECVGGTSVRDNINSLKNGCQIVCGTPGRIIDMMEKRFLSARDLDIIILDEADELLKRNFKHQIYQILEGCRDEVQVCLYSATMPGEVIEIAEQFLRDPAVSLLDEDNLTLDGIKQFYVDCGESQWKLDTLLDLYGVLNCSKAFIFVNENERAAHLCEKLRERDFTPSVITGTMMQNERNNVLREFRMGKTNLLISSDLLARGIDIQGVDLVINFDFPTDRENYIHRIGRSGRHGRKGVAINFITKKDYKLVEEYEAFYHTKINELPCDVDGLFD